MSNTPRAVRKAGAVPVANPLAADIRPGQSIELLKELHILTREGKLNQDSRRKLKQVYHLFQFIEKLLLELPDGGAHATLADHGAGKSYLGFIIYCRIPDDCIDSKRYPLFMARDVMRVLIEQLQAEGATPS